MTPTRTWDIDALLDFHRAHFGDARMDGDEDPPATDTGFTPITTQEELNTVIGDRVKRAKPADYDDLRAKAAKLDQLESAAKPELERLTERAATADALVSAMPAKIAESLRAHLVDLGVVAKEDEVLLTASNPEELIAQVKRLSARAADRLKNGNVVPNEGRTPPAGSNSDVREFARGLFGTAN